MYSSTEIAGTLKRSTPLTQSRVLVILACLDTSTALDRNLSESAILAILKFSYPGIPPHFLFAVSTNDKIIRSPDKGESWIELPVAVPPSLPGVNSVLCSKPESSKEWKPSLKMDEETLKSGNKNSFSRLSHVSAYKDVVAIGGQEGVLYISSNKGLEFTEIKNLSLHWKDHLDIRGLCVLNSETVVATNGSVVTSVKFLVGNCLKCVRTFDIFGPSSCGGISWIGCNPFTSDCTELIISEPGVLSFSWNEGKSFISFPHSLGEIRACDNMMAIRACELPPFPASSRILSKLQHSEVKNGGSSFEYSSKGTGLLSYEMRKKIAASFFSVEMLPNVSHSSALFDRPNFLYRCFFVVGVRTAVLPFDYSGFLCIGVKHNIEIKADSDIPVSLFTIANHVSYIPYSRSTSRSPLSCIVSRLTPEQRCTKQPCSFLACRGNTATGTSFSQDFRRWEDGGTSAAVALLPSDGGEILVCTQRNVFTLVQVSIGLKGWSTFRARHALPQAMRIPSLCTVSYS